MLERVFIKSSYSDEHPISGSCVEASAPDGFRFPNLITRCGDIACGDVTVQGEMAFVSSAWSGGNGGNCVEVGGRNTTALLRDSKCEESDLIAVSPEAYTAFVGFTATQEYARLEA